MIVVFDSGIWISAFQFGGVPLEALDQSTGRFQIALCDPIIAEIRSVLQRKFNWREESIDEALEEYSTETLTVPVSGALRGVCRDRNDDMVIECALEAGASLIDSGDKDLLAVGQYEGIRVLTPRAFLKREPGY